LYICLRANSFDALLNNTTGSASFMMLFFWGIRWKPTFKNPASGKAVSYARIGHKIQSLQKN
jgi:hypothetical protein